MKMIRVWCPGRELSKVASFNFVYLTNMCICRWCGPCKLLGPRLESLIASKAGSVLMAKVDIDENSDLALDHGVRKRFKRGVLH